MSSTEEYEQQQYWLNESTEDITYFEVFPPREKSFNPNQKVETMTLEEIMKRYPLTVEQVNALKEKQK